MTGSQEIVRHFQRLPFPRSAGDKAFRLLMDASPLQSTSGVPLETPVQPFSHNTPERRKSRRIAHLKPLSPHENSSPFSTNWDNTILGCAIASKEATDDLREWLQYHKWVGLDHVVLFDNSHDGGQQSKDVRDFVEEGFLTWIVLDGIGKQVGAYQYCADHFARSYSWLVMLDLDEFIVVTEDAHKLQPGALKFITQDFRFDPGLWLQWIVFGPSDHEHRPPSGGPLAHYTKCVPATKPLNMYGKLLANTFWLRTVSNAHAAYYRGDGMHVTDAREPMPPVFDEATQQLIRASSRVPPWLDKTRSPARGARAAVQHYLTRSHDDYVLKMGRGTSDKASGASIRTPALFERVAQEERRSPTCEAGVQLAAKCCYKDGQPWPPRPAAGSELPTIEFLPEDQVQTGMGMADKAPASPRPLPVHPFSEKWQSDVIVCAPLPSEVAPATLRDWVEHHKRQGVRKIVLVDVRETPASGSEQTSVRKLLRTFPKGAVDYRPNVLSPPPLTSDAVHSAANHECMDVYGQATSWIVFLRVGDYVILRGGTQRSESLPSLLHEPRFRFSPGVVAPVYKFLFRSEGAAGAAPGRATNETLDLQGCKYAGETDVRTIGNTFWVDASTALQEFHYRGDLVPVTDMGQKHIFSARFWNLGVKHPLPWHDMQNYTKYTNTPSFGTRLAVISFIYTDPHSSPGLESLEAASGSALELQSRADARDTGMNHDTNLNALQLCRDILRLANIAPPQEPISWHDVKA